MAAQRHLLNNPGRKCLARDERFPELLRSCVQNVKELIVYQKAYDLTRRIFDMTRYSLPEERFVLTSRIRRSSRSVCMNLREAWAKRRYPAHIVSKLSDCDGENAETDTSLDFARDCAYISDQAHVELTALNREVGRMLGSMIKRPDKFTLGHHPDS